MLISYGAKNFFCFKEWVEVSLAFNSNVPIEISRDEPAARTLCFKGANASGKTNAIKILSFLSYFCTNSFLRKPDDEIPIETFFENTDPTEFTVTFQIDDIEYTYELVLNKEKVIDEKIFKKSARQTLVFHRSNEDIVVNSLFDTSKEIGIRKNASIISTTRQYELPETLPFYSFFSKIRTNVGHFGLSENQLTHNQASEFYGKNKNFLEFTKKYLNKFDTGIRDIEIVDFTYESKETVFFPLFKYKVGDKSNSLLYLGQSSGTKSLYLFLIQYKLALDNGGILALDEFDINLHPDILPHLVNLFENTETNPLHAQLIFSTHNNDIIEDMGKYKIYLFNKENNECYGYRLDEIPGNVIRNDRPILPIYRSGKIGGIPRKTVINEQV